MHLTSLPISSLPALPPSTLGWRESTSCQDPKIGFSAMCKEYNFTHKTNFLTGELSSVSQVLKGSFYFQSTVKETLFLGLMI